MRPKFWTPNLRRSSPDATGRLSISLLLWFLVGLLLPWLLKSVELHRSDAKQLSFEEALKTVAALGEARGSDGSAPFGQPQYGITQAVYDAWRRSQNQPSQNISRISQTEVWAIYQRYWQQGECDRYTPPLDIVCLDSLISLGRETGQRLLVNLPDDPRTASLEVARRRQAFRQQSESDADRVPAQRQERQHDRDLVAFIESYSPSQQAEFSAGLRQWLASEPPAAVAKSIESDEQPSSASPSATKLSSEQIYQQAKPFVVEVWISTTGIIAPAAGILLTSDGLVLTNYHVINEASFDFVRSPSGEDFNGTVIEVDPGLDLALIQLEGARNLPTAKLSSRSSHIKIGDIVYAIGSPLAAHWKMTEAEVIEVNSDCGLPSLQCIRTPKGFLKPGNSGGPLLDSTGQVVGVNRAIQDGTGEGVSIPIETIKQFVEQTQSVPN